MRSLALLCSVVGTLAHERENWNGYEYSMGVFELLIVIFFVGVCVWWVVPQQERVVPRADVCDVSIDPENCRRVKRRDSWRDGGDQFETGRR